MQGHPIESNGYKICAETNGGRGCWTLSTHKRLMKVPIRTAPKVLSNAGTLGIEFNGLPGDVDVDIESG